jgi:FkbM family methyltransferase
LKIRVSLVRFRVRAPIPPHAQLGIRGARSDAANSLEGGLEPGYKRMRGQDALQPMRVVPDLVFDVGLHKGEDTAFYLAKGYRVVAFDADPELVAHCRERFREALASDRLQIIEGAITNEPVREVTFYKNTVCSVWGTVNPAWEARNRAMRAPSMAITVPRIDIADAFRRYGIPHFLKIDIEGSDRVVLAALREFETRPRYLSMESELVDFAKLERELQDLADLGYRRFRVVQQRFIPHSRVSVDTLDGGRFEHVFEEGASGPFGDDLELPWMSHAECREQYRRIFRRYRLFGSRALIRRIPVATRVLNRVEKITRVPIPGWCDTHATLDE